MSSRLSTLRLISVLLLSLSAWLCVSDPVEASPFISADSDVALAIVDVEQRIVVCYSAVAEADNVGANVTALLARLNEAGWHLSRARWAYELGDFDAASYYALLSEGRLEGFVAEAETLKETAVAQQYWDFMVNVVGSIVGTLVVVCGSFGVWVLLKRRHDNARSVV